MDETTACGIDSAAWKTLREAGLTRPPVHAEFLLQHLDLHRDFYDLGNPTFLDRTKHKLKIHGVKLVDVVRKIKLVAVLLFDENRIVIGSEVPDSRRDWPTFHEMAHRILVWHKPYFFGDTAQTLDPDWHERLELEANYCASSLMFCGPVFTQESLDTAPAWQSVEALRKRYGKSYMTTLRRYVEHGPHCEMAMLVSTPYWEDKPEDQPRRWRHFVRSPEFLREFGGVTPAKLLELVDSNVTKRRGGPVGEYSIGLVDDNGAMHEFRAESFYNRHDILTLFARLKQVVGTRIVMAQ